MGSRKFPVADWAASELSVQREVLDLEDDPDIVAVLQCWDGRVFTVADGVDPWSLHRGLTALANGCDDHVERSKDPETRNHNRWARDGLTGLATRIVSQ